MGVIDRNSSDNKDATHVERVMTGDEKMPVAEDVNRDHTGAAKKTDPEEIKLVRKLDWCIMVRPLQPT
jgi:hypothetical protein